MKTKPRINDCFADWRTNGGIFSALQTYNTVPWYAENISTSLDIIYHSMRSGQKYASPLVRELLDDDGELTNASKLLIATSILAIYNANWAKEWETRSFQYNPIENYSMTETMTDDQTVTEFGHVNTRENDLTHTKTGTETQTPDLTDETTPDLSTDNAVYGFNSVTAVPSGSSTQSGTNTTTRTGTDEMEYNTTDTDSGSVTDTESGENTSTRNYELTRAGNIGVTTSQQMIQSERELWIWNYFYDVVFPDIDKIMTLNIY